MRDSLGTFISRRSILKAGALSAVILALPTFSLCGVAQTSNPTSAKAGSQKPTGLISFNAGWMIPVEDQKALLALEEKKNKEAQALASQTPQAASSPPEAVKPAKKSWTEKLQDSWNQVKNFF